MNTNKQLFECHITYNKHDYKWWKDHNDLHHVLSYDKWKYSEIYGDPVLGQKLYCYLTKYGSDKEFLVREARELAALIELNSGVPAVRIKVEQIVFDERYD